MFEMDGEIRHAQEAARLANETAGASAEDASKGDPLNATGIFIPERDIERRADSPPIPSMRGKQPPNGNQNFGGSQAKQRRKR